MKIELEKGQSPNDVIERQSIAAVYVKSSGCSVCEALQPKISAFFKDHYNQIPLVMLDAEKHMEWIAEQGIFSAPILLIFADHKEQFRFGRNISLLELESKLARLCNLMQND